MVLLAEGGMDMTATAAVPTASRIPTCKIFPRNIPIRLKH